MIIVCPHCQSRFRLEENRLSRGRPMLRCSRCRGTFLAPAGKARHRPSRPVEEESLSFSFDDEDDWDDSPLAQDKPTKGERGAELTHEEGPTDAGQDFADDEELLPGDANLTQLDFADDEEDEAEDLPRSRISVKPVFVFLILVVAAYGLFARALYADPSWAIKIMATTPLIGDDLSERELDREVAVMNLQGRHERTKDGKMVFFITGTAMNESGSRLSKVQVESTLYDAQDNLIDRKATYCGNTVRVDLIRSLSVAQVKILSGLKPPHRFGVQPGATCPFVTIFTNPPAALASFRTEVANVEHQG